MRKISNYQLFRNEEIFGKRTYSAPFSLRALRNYSSYDGFREGISFPSMTTLTRWLARISVIAV